MYAQSVPACPDSFSERPDIAALNTQLKSALKMGRDNSEIEYLIDQIADLTRRPRMLRQDEVQLAS